MSLKASLILRCCYRASAPRRRPRGFARYFTADTMRVDYFHTGGPKAGETLSLDRVVNDGPWAGSRTQLVDTTNLGHYLFEVRDKASGTLLYSRGFASVYGEWETTGEEKTLHRTFHESLRFPWPTEPVAITLRQAAGGQPLRAGVVDRRRSGLAVRQPRADPPARRPGVAGIRERPAVGEGRHPRHRRGLHRRRDAEVSRRREAAAALFAEEPFKSRRSDFNVRALDLPSAESGVNRPNAGVFRRTPLSAEYNIFDSERYVLTLDNRALRDAASAAPYEFIEILVNDKTYGGGGIFNDQATASVDSAFSPYVFVHEFGHHFAALADEYYTSDVAFEPGARRSRSRGNRT